MLLLPPLRVVSFLQHHQHHHFHLRISSSCYIYFTTFLLLFLLSLPTTTAFSNTSPSSPPPPPPPPPPLIDRVPTFRLYQQGHCQVQVPGKGDVGECRVRLHEAITGLTKKASMKIRSANREEGSDGGLIQAAAPPPTKKGVRPILEIASLEALEEMLLLQKQQPQPSPLPQQNNPNEDDDEVLLVEFYGQSCKQCILLQPLFESLPWIYRDRPLRFAKADVTNFPTLVIPPPDPSVFYELDRSAEIDARLEGCPRCGGSGFVVCGECEGKGHIVRKAPNGQRVADICMSCVGHKKVPCTQCGGKCYLC